MDNDQAKDSSASFPNFEARAKASLDDSIRQIDAGTQHRLHAMRRLALAQSVGKSGWHRLGNQLVAHWQHSLAGFILLSALLLLVLSPTRPHFMSSTKLSAQPAAMVDLLDNPDDLEILGDPGFYVWATESGSIN